MNQDKDNEIVPAGSHSLLKRSSGLVRRGLKELSKADGRRGRILLVDDEEAIIEVTQQILIDQGYEVRSARRADEAIKIARAFEPQVAMLGLIMPAMDGVRLGIELCRFLPKTKFVLWVEVDGDEDLSELRRDGYDFGLFPAPFQKEVLFKQIELWLSESAAMDRTWYDKALTLERLGCAQGAIRSYENYLVVAPPEAETQFEHALIRLQELKSRTQKPGATVPRYAYVVRDKGAPIEAGAIAYPDIETAILEALKEKRALYTAGKLSDHDYWGLRNQYQSMVKEHIQKQREEPSE